MRLANIQAYWLLQTLKDTLTLEANIFSYTRKQRLDMYNQIINQQDNRIVELGLGLDNTGMFGLESECEEKPNEGSDLNDQTG